MSYLEMYFPCKSVIESVIESRSVVNDHKIFICDIVF